MIRKEYLCYTIQTTDGRVLHGLIVEQTPAHVTLVNARAEKVVIERRSIASRLEYG